LRYGILKTLGDYIKFAEKLCWMSIEELRHHLCFGPLLWGVMVLLSCHQFVHR